MKAYVISDIEVTDPERFEQYKLLSAQSVALHGGQFLVRGGNFETVEGTWTPTRLAVIEFPSLEAAQTWIGSDDYAPARLIRQSSANTNIVVVDGAS